MKAVQIYMNFVQISWSLTVKCSVTLWANLVNSYEFRTNLTKFSHLVHWDLHTRWGALTGHDPKELFHLVVDTTRRRRLQDL